MREAGAAATTAAVARGIVKGQIKGTIADRQLVARLARGHPVVADLADQAAPVGPTLDDGRATRALGLLRSIATDFQVIYLTTSPRYDDEADAVVVLDGPTALDTGADGLPTNGTASPEPEDTGRGAAPIGQRG